MFKRIALIAIVSLVSWSVTALFTSSFAQPTNADIQKQLKEAMDQAQKASGTMKGWTCRHMEDGGRRMSVMDTTGTKKMNGIPSSEAGLHDNTTPLEKLPPCDFSGFR